MEKEIQNLLEWQRKSKELKERIASDDEAGIEETTRSIVKLTIRENIDELFGKLKRAKNSMDETGETSLEFLLHRWDQSLSKLEKAVRNAMETNDREFIEDTRHNVEMTIDEIKEDEYVTKKYKEELCKIFEQLESLLSNRLWQA